MLSAPPQFSRPNHQSALDNAEFVEASLAELLANRCARTVAGEPHICSPLSVVSNRAGKKRLVLNLHFLNQFLLKDKFKYEDIRLAMLIFQKDDFMFSFDLVKVSPHRHTPRALELPWICLEQWLQSTALCILHVTFWLGNSLLSFHQAYASPS